MTEAAEPRQLVTLTDEEIVALDGTDAVAPKLWYDALPSQARRVAVEVAARGLVARGWASANQLATSMDELQLEPVGPLRDLLGLRRAARLIVVGEQQLAGETRARVLYLLPAPGELAENALDLTALPSGQPFVLEEAVNSGGLHRFTPLSGANALEALADWCVALPSPPQARTGRRVPLDPTVDLEAAVAAVVGAPRVVTVLAAVSGAVEPPVQRYLTVYVGDAGLAVASRDESGARVRSTTRADLVGQLAELMRAVVE